MNTLAIQLLCLCSAMIFIFCFRLLGVGFKPFAAGMALVILVWLVVAVVVLLGFAKLALSGQLSSLSVGGTMALVMAVGFILWLASTVIQARQVPPIHHISTDVIDPPSFEKIISLRDASHNSLDYTPEIAKQQQAHYLSLQPMISPASVDVVFQAAIALVDQHGWQLQHHDPGAGVIEASDTTGIFGFVDDIAIRVKAEGEGTVVDMRSVSRVGRSDLGANAKRIQTFLADLSAAIGK